jgi:hypothetical protein
MTIDPRDLEPEEVREARAFLARIAVKAERNHRIFKDGSSRISAHRARNALAVFDLAARMLEEGPVLNDNAFELYAYPEPGETE